MVARRSICRAGGGLQALLSSAWGTRQVCRPHRSLPWAEQPKSSWSDPIVSVPRSARTPSDSFLGGREPMTASSRLPPSGAAGTSRAYLRVAPGIPDTLVTNGDYLRAFKAFHGCLLTGRTVSDKIYGWHIPRYKRQNADSLSMIAFDLCSIDLLQRVMPMSEVWVGSFGNPARISACGGRLDWSPGRPHPGSPSPLLPDVRQGGRGGRGISSGGGPKLGLDREGEVATSPPLDDHFPA